MKLLKGKRLDSDSRVPRRDFSPFIGVHSGVGTGQHRFRPSDEGLVGKVTPPSRGVCYNPEILRRSGIEERSAPTSVGRGIRPRNALGMLAKRLQATRLETRTKESNMLASVWVENPGRATKVKGREPPTAGGAPTPGPTSSMGTGSRRSTYVGTRKMVNYA